MVPEPVDEGSFRRALERLLAGAARNEVEVADQSWKCVPEGSDSTWDVEITVVDPGTEIE
jgi:hypothetical protein